MAAVDVNDLSVEELRERALESRRHEDAVFAVALVERIDRQAATIRELFADVVRLSMTREPD